MTLPRIARMCNVYIGRSKKKYSIWLFVLRWTLSTKYWRVNFLMSHKKKTENINFIWIFEKLYICLLKNWVDGVGLSVIIYEGPPRIEKYKKFTLTKKLQIKLIKGAYILSLSWISIFEWMMVRGGFLFIPHRILRVGQHIYINLEKY